MKTFFLVLGFALALVLPGASFAQDDVWSKGFVFNSASNSGTDVWFGPGNKISTNGPLANQINGLMGRGNSTLVSAASGGLNVAETGAVAMRDGRVLAMTATRFASTANIFKAVKAVAGGPVGVSLLLHAITGRSRAAGRSSKSPGPGACRHRRGPRQRSRRAARRCRRQNSAREKVRRSASSPNP